jgi:hypothetical protein
MKKIFILLLMITSAFIIAHLKVNIPTVRAAPPIHQGDLIISGNDVFTIKGETFIINGSIRVTENATLELKDAVINFTQRIDNDHGILFYSGNTKLKADNVTIISTYDTFMVLDTNCSANVDDLHSPMRIYLELFNANLNMSNSEVHWYFGSDSNVTISNCEIKDIKSWGDDILISESTIGPCYVVSSSIMTHNSTIEDINATGKASIFVLNNLIVNGSVSLYGNATLHLEDAFLELSQIHDEESNMTFNDYSSLQSVSSEVNSDHVFIMYFYGESTASVNGLVMPTSLARLYAFDESVLNLNAFTSRYLRAFNDSIITLSNSAPYYLRSYYRANFYIYNCTIQKQYAFDLGHVHISKSVYTVDLRSYNNTYVDVSDSIIDSVYAYDTSAINLVNCTYTHYTVEPDATAAHIYVRWYLDAKVVDLTDQPIPSANVTAYLGPNLKDSNLTNIQGCARLVLLGAHIDMNGIHYMQMNYSVGATYEDYVTSKSVNMTDNKVITLELDFIIPEFPSIAILPWIMIATLLAAAISHRKRYST